MSIRVCTEWAEESYQECSRWEDQGYNACDSWDDQCCDWWPCSWGCKLISWICVAWVWISNVVCVAWATITTLACVAWEVISVLVIPLTWLLEIILAIPIIGRLIDEIINIATTIYWRVIGIIEAIGTLIGIRPLKKVRVCIIILRDENGNPVTTEANLQPDITAAQTIFRNAANLQVIVDGIHTVEGACPTFALDVNCNVAAWGEDLWVTGSYFDALSAWYCPTGGLGRLTGYANPIIVFCVRSIPGGTAGCALGPLTDYLTIEGGNPVCLAHEMGHKLGLWHCCPATNLANGICGGTTLDWWQVVIVRNSEFTSYI